MENNKSEKPSIQSEVEISITEKLNTMLPDAIVEPKLIDELQTALKELATKEIIEN